MTADRNRPGRRPFLEPPPGDLYRVRQGNYRILDEIIDHDLTVTVIKIGHRREVYR